MPGRPLLHTPGPTHIPDRVLNAMHRQAVDFAAPDFQDFVAEMFLDLKQVFATDGEVFVYSANGHGVWEATIVNLLAPGDTVLMPETGRFSGVWKLMTEVFEINVETIPNDWRQAVDPAMVEEHLRQDTEHKIKAVFLVHVETATGVVSDARAIRHAIDAAGHPALFVVDAIASMLTTPLPMNDWNIDVVLAASQKGFMLPPGLAFTGVSKKAMRAAETGGSRREYWSWTARLGAEQYRRFCGTPPEHFLWGLREALDMVAEEGLENLFARHARLAEAARRAVAKWTESGPLEFNAIHPHERSNSITAIRTPEGLDAETIRATARDVFQVQLGGGLSQLAGKVFRLGHMGDLNAPMLLGAIGGVEATLQLMGIPYGRGGVDAAVSYLAETAERHVAAAE